MPKGRDIRREALDQLIAELDAKARQQQVSKHSEQHPACQRRHPRYAFRADCTIRFIGQDQREIVCLPGRTRNLSRGGLAILVNHVFTVGDPIEVELQLPSQPVMFIAGLIHFVRYAGRDYHELGIAIRCASPKPVFSSDPAAAMSTLDWMRYPTTVGE